MKEKMTDIVLYTAPNGKARLEVNIKDETIWLNQAQIAVLFDTQRPAITKHLRNIFKEMELQESSVCSILEHTAADGKKYKTQYYNLDAIISVGYRVNSKQATQFRIWATSVLREYVLKGVVVNEKRLKAVENLSQLEKTVSLLQSIVHSKLLSKSEALGLLSVITEYAHTWIVLQEYDDGMLRPNGTTKRKGQSITYDEARGAIAQLQGKLQKDKRASDLFGREREHGLDGVLKSIHQSFGGKELYSTLEEKAAHLLYFVIKNHPFTDGNKRIGSFLFIIFLKKNRILHKKDGEKKINDNALVALALLIAESKPSEKEVMVSIVANLLKG